MTEFKDTNFTVFVPYPIPENLDKPIPESVTWLYCFYVFKRCYNTPLLYVEEFDI
jgi:hypothetical protein